MTVARQRRSPTDPGLTLILGDTPLTTRIVTQMKGFAWAYHVDVKSYSDVAGLLEAMRPRLVVNAIEVDDVALCESSPDVAISANALGAANVAMACRLYDAGLVQLSTDQVFGSSGPHKYTDEPYPQNSYGVSKMLGENAVHNILHDRAMVIRVGSLYGPEVENCQPYIAMTQGGLRANNGPEKAYIDHGSFVIPTYIGHVASLVAETLNGWMLTAEDVRIPLWARQVIHIGPWEDPITWHDLLVNDFTVLPFQGQERLNKRRSTRYRSVSGLVPTEGWRTPGYREGLDAFIEEFREAQHSQAGTRA